MHSSPTTAPTLEMPARWRVATALVGLCVAQAVACAGARGQTTGATWAVVVGVNDYIAFDEDTGDLRGAEHDAQSFYDVLVNKMGVPPERIRMLLSREATKAGIQEALTTWLRTRVRPGDRAIFFYAGHGSQAFDQNGDEADGLDETLAPADVLLDSPVNDILDDELREWLAALSASEIVVILDSCNSGTATRDLGLYARPRRLERALRGRVAAAQPGEFELLDDSGDLSRIVEIAAAAPGQSAMDSAFLTDDGQIDFFGGAFTTNLVWTLWLAPRDATFREVFRRARSTLKSARFSQDPQFTAASDLPLFRDETTPVTTEAPEVVELGADRTAVLSGGQAGQIGENVVLRTSTGGLLLVTHVRATDVVARVLRDPVRVGDRLSTAGQMLPDRPLRVAVQTLSPDEVRRIADQVSAGSDVDWLEAGEVARADIVVARGPEGRLVVLGRDTQAREAPPPSPGQDPLAWVAGRIDWELAVQKLSALATASTRYDVRVSMNALDGSYREGAPIEITVDSDLAGYVTLLVMDVEGSLAVILPNPYSGALQITPGAPLTVPGTEAPFAFDAAPPYGLGFVEAIVTPEPLELMGVDPETLSTSDASGLSRSITSQIGGQAGEALDPGVATPGEELLGDRPWAAGLVSYEVHPASPGRAPAPSGRDH